MKTNRTLIRLFVVTFMAMLFHGCQKDFDLLDHPSAEVQGEAGVLEKAKEWYRQNMQHAKGTSDLDVRLLTPDWENYLLSENAAGQPWISVPLKNQAHPDVFLTQISLIIDKKGRANGIIKEYKKNPHIEDTELTIYTGSGKLYEKGTYKHKRRSLFVKQKGKYLTGKYKLYRIAYGQKLAMERTSLNFFKVAGGSGGNDGGEIAWELEIEEVIVPPPSGGGGPGYDPWEDPWEGYNPWENGDWEGGGDTGGGGGGGGSGSVGGGIPSQPGPTPEDVYDAHIDDSELLDCMKDVLTDLKSLSGNSVADIILKFSDELPGYNLRFDNATDSIEKVAWVKNEITDGYITINFNTDRRVIDNVTDLAIATTILHESIHAYLYAFYKDDPAAAQETYPELFSRYFWQKHGVHDGDTQHNLMVKNFMKDIAKSVKAFGNKQGYILSDSYYEDLAWKGLTETKAFKAMDTADKSRIINVIKAEQYGVTTPQTPQKGTPAGC